MVAGDYPVVISSIFKTMCWLKLAKEAVHQLATKTCFSLELPRPANKHKRALFRAKIVLEQALVNWLITELWRLRIYDFSFLKLWRIHARRAP